MWKLRPDVVLAALWAALAVHVVRRRLRAIGIRTRVPRPPHMGARAGLGVMAVLFRLQPTCLERALVLQSWLTMRGKPLDVVIGIPRDGMRSGPAHAWLDGMDAESSGLYLELHRLGANR